MGQARVLLRRPHPLLQCPRRAGCQLPSEVCRPQHPVAKAPRVGSGLGPCCRGVGSTGSAPVAEYDGLCGRGSSKALSLRENNQLDIDIDKLRNSTADEVYREILRRGDQIPRLINQAISAAKSRSPSALRDQTTVFSRDFVVEALRDGGSVRDPSSNKPRTQRASELTAEEAQVAAMKGALQFVGFMLSPRHYNLRT